MISESDNKLLTEIGPKSPMGQFMREYWMPILRSDQLKPGAAPTRLKILSEPLVAFRSPGGEAGVMNEACPHRGASMATARNEECGLRCVYHGWKIAPSGDLLEAPTHGGDAPLHKMKTRSYKVWEGQGMIWAWLGEGKAPAPPRFAFSDLPDDHVMALTATLNCGWLHPLETLWDVFHSQILHNQTNRNSYRKDYYFKGASQTAGELAFNYPEMITQRTDYGFTYKNVDEAKETNFRYIVPFMLINTVSPNPMDDRALQISVPIDDEHCLLWVVLYNRNGPLKANGVAMKSFGDVSDPNDFLKEMGERTPETYWGQNRAAMESGESYSGITSVSGGVRILAEDIIMIESQGRLDRTKELLSPIDKAVIEGRNTILDAVKAYQKGEPPLGRDLDHSSVEALFLLREAAE